jgi:ABC-type Fe3+-hydroxamate transport system substrate-binding protein
VLRVVSLVPSLTEAVAVTVPEILVGATDYCTHPAGLDVARVGGSKYPSLERILALRPDLVLMNAEENRLSDASALEAASVPIYRTYPLTVDDALRELGEMLAFLGVTAEPDWLRAARAAWAPPGSAPLTPMITALSGKWLPKSLGRQPYPGSGSDHASGAAPVRAVIPVWRKPWIVLGRDTFAGDVLRRLGIGNVFGDDPERYPRPSHDEILARRPDLAVLPDEPYAFTEDDGPQYFPGIRRAFVSGRHLTWYGPSLAEAPVLLRSQLCSGQL